MSPLQAKAKGLDDICILEKGTLVIAVHSKEGLVVCADKRVYYIEENITKDEKIKIIQAGGHGLFASVGMLSFTRTAKIDPKPVSIEVDRLVENYFKKRILEFLKMNSGMISVNTLRIFLMLITTKYHLMIQASHSFRWHFFILI